MIPIKGQAFSFLYPGLTPMLLTDITMRSSLSNSSASVKALWDTGATNSCISKEIAQSMGLVPTGFRNIHTPSGECQCPTYLVNVLLPNEVEIQDVVVCGTEIRKQGFDMLVGMDIILLGDFVVTNKDKQTLFSFCYPAQSRIDYVKQINAQNVVGPKHGKGIRKKK